MKIIKTFSLTQRTIDILEKLRKDGINISNFIDSLVQDYARDKLNLKTMSDIALEDMRLKTDYKAWYNDISLDGYKDLSEGSDYIKNMLIKGITKKYGQFDTKKLLEYLKYKYTESGELAVDLDQPPKNMEKENEPKA